MEPGKSSTEQGSRAGTHFSHIPDCKPARTAMGRQLRCMCARALMLCSTGTPEGPQGCCPTKGEGRPPPGGQGGGRAPPLPCPFEALLCGLRRPEMREIPSGKPLLAAVQRQGLLPRAAKPAIKLSHRWLPSRSRSKPLQNFLRLPVHEHVSNLGVPLFGVPTVIWAKKTTSKMWGFRSLLCLLLISTGAWGVDSASRPSAPPTLRLSSNQRAPGPARCRAQAVLASTSVF